jgi:hypothetical protein
VYIEVAEPAPAVKERSGREPAGFERDREDGAEQKKTDKVKKKFSDMIAHIRPAAETVLKTFQELNTPDEIALEFGLKFSSKVNAFMFASVDGESTFKVALKWQNKKKETGTAK